MKKQLAGILFLLAMISAFPDWSMAQAAAGINISGSVTDALSHLPIANAQVSIEIDGGFSASNAAVPVSIQSAAIPSLSPYIWGQRTIVNTNSNGQYSANIQIPSFIPSASMYAKIVVASQGQATYGTQVGTVSLATANANSGTVPSYTFNFSLSFLNYGAFVSGVVQDASTNEVLPSGFVTVTCGSQNNYLTVDDQGQFFGEVPLLGQTQTCNVSVDPSVNYLANPGVNGISYQLYYQSIQLNSGQSTIINPQLVRNPAQTAFVGQITDAVTGLPIPYVLIQIVEGQPGVGPFGQSTVATDIFGRFVLPVYAGMDADLAHISIITSGAFFPVGSSGSPYTSVILQEGNSIVQGDITNLNISLNKNPAITAPNTCALVPSNATACPGTPAPTTNEAPYTIVDSCASTACTATCNSGYILSAGACVADTCASLPSNTIACPGTSAPTTNGTAYTIVGTCASTVCTATCNTGYVLSGGSCIAAPVIPSAPVGFNVTLNGDQVNLTWSPSLGAQSYNVKRSTVSGKETTIANVTTTSYTDTAVTPLTTYYYVVSAVNASGESANSVEFNTTPAPPNVIITASAGTGGTISPSGAVSVYYEGGQIFTLTPQTGYIASLKVDGQAVTLTNNAYILSNVTSAHTLVASFSLLASPTGLSPTAGNAQVALTWNASANATLYTVYRSMTNGGPYTAITVPPINGTSYTDTGLQNGTTYYYVVTANANFTQSGYSNQVSAIPDPPPPLAPTNLTPTPGNSQVALNWTASTGATTYNVLRSAVSGASYLPIATEVTALNYTDYTVVNGNTYYYVVEAVNAGGFQSGYSNQATATLVLPPPVNVQVKGQLIGVNSVVPSGITVTLIPTSANGTPSYYAVSDNLGNYNFPSVLSYTSASGGTRTAVTYFISIFAPGYLPYTGSPFNVISTQLPYATVFTEQSIQLFADNCATVPSNATACAGTPAPTTNGSAYTIVNSCGGGACTATCKSGYILSGGSCVIDTCAAVPTNATACPGTPAPTTNGAGYTIVNNCGGGTCTATCQSGYTLSGGSCVPAAVPGGWTTWPSWSTATCNPANNSKTIYRSCTNPAPANGGAECQYTSADQSNGVICSIGNPNGCLQEQESQSCVIPVSGGWTAWPSWSTVTCNPANNSETIYRSCTNPVPANGGAECQYSSVDQSNGIICSVGNPNGCLQEQESQSCVIPVSGGWTAWPSWSTVTCNPANNSETIYRSCTNPVPANGGAECQYSSVDQSNGIICSVGNPNGCLQEQESQSCVIPVSGGWTAWPSWSTVTCNPANNSETIYRSCTNPVPANGGAECQYSSVDQSNGIICSVGNPNGCLQEQESQSCAPVVNGVAKRVGILTSLKVP